VSVSPERWLLQSIASGELDVHLPAIARAIDARQHLLHTMDSIDALAQLVVDDRVRINQHARPRYLQGLHATMIDVDTVTATVSLERPIYVMTNSLSSQRPSSLGALTQQPHANPTAEYDAAVLGPRWWIVALGSMIVCLVALGTTTGSAAASVPRCTAAHLKAWAGPVQGNLGTDLAEFAFINTSSKKCSLIGYPKVQMLNGAGQQIATTDRDSPVSAFPDITRKLVVLAKGKRAYFGVFYPDHTGSGTMVCPPAATLELTPPGSTQAVTLRGSGAAITPYAGSDAALGCGLVQPTLVSAKGL
jgi:hypothetical protein